MAKYKDVIREQDGQIQHLRQRLAALEGGHIAAQVWFSRENLNAGRIISWLSLWRTQSKIEELNVNVQHLQDQNTLLKAQRNNNVIIDEGEPSTPPPESSTDKLVKELEALRLDNERLRGQLEEQQQAANHYVGIPPSVSIPVMMRMHFGIPFAAFAWFTDSILRCM